MAEVAVIESGLEARPEDVGMSSRRLRQVSRLVNGYVDDGKIPGAITLIARGGKVVFYEAVGRMDVEADKAMTDDTIFRIYSMTKPIASVALMMLYEEARFQLDDPISKHIPQFEGLEVFVRGTAERYQTRPCEREMSVRDVLMHTSGLIGGGRAHPVAELYQRAELRGSRSDGTLADMIEKVGRLPLYCDPGSEWNYGISTDVVGYLCEVFSGQPFDRYLEERIFAPLGMKDTGFQVPADQADRFAACYRREGGGYTLSDAPGESVYLTPRRYFSGAGGLVSTADDYMRFCKMLAGGGELDDVRILGTRTLDYMTRNHLPNGSDLAAMGQPQFTETRMDGIGFGLGFAVLLDPTVAQIIGTPGEYYWGGAASTAFFVSPGEDMSLIFLTQLMPSGTYPFRRELRAVTYQAITD